MRLMLILFALVFLVIIDQARFNGAYGASLMRAIENVVRMAL
jgi:hypothetical protein